MEYHQQSHRSQMRKCKSIKRKVGRVRSSIKSTTHHNTNERNKMEIVSKYFGKWKKQKDNLQVPIREAWRTRATQLKCSKKIKNIKSTEFKDNKNPKENEEIKIFQRIKMGKCGIFMSKVPKRQIQKKTQELYYIWK